MLRNEIPQISMAPFRCNDDNRRTGIGFCGAPRPASPKAMNRPASIPEGCTEVKREGPRCPPGPCLPFVLVRSRPRTDRKDGQTKAKL